MRAHGKGGSGIQTDVEWSDFSDPIRCTVAATALEPAAAGDRAGASRFTLMYRVSEVWGGRLWGREYAPPDFLASHNSADGPGQASFLTFAELRSAPASLLLARWPEPEPHERRRGCCCAA